MSDEAIVILCCIGIVLCISIGMYGAICENIRRYAFDILREIRMAERELIEKAGEKTRPRVAQEQWELRFPEKTGEHDA